MGMVASPSSGGSTTFITDMVKVIIDYSDGRFSFRSADETWPDAIEIPDSLWEAYQDFCLQCHMWHRIIGRLDNDRYRDE